MVESKEDGWIRLSGKKRPMRAAYFTIKDGELKFYSEDGKAVLVVHKDWRYEVFHEAHSGMFAGHVNAHRIMIRLGKEVYWPRIAQDISGPGSAKSVLRTTEAF